MVIYDVLGSAPRQLCLEKCRTGYWHLESRMLVTSCHTHPVGRPSLLEINAATEAMAIFTREMMEKEPSA